MNNIITILYIIIQSTHTVYNMCISCIDIYNYYVSMNYMNKINMNDINEPMQDGDGFWGVLRL